MVDVILHSPTVCHLQSYENKSGFCCDFYPSCIIFWLENSNFYHPDPDQCWVLVCEFFIFYFFLSPSLSHCLFHLVAVNSSLSWTRRPGCGVKPRQSLPCRMSQWDTPCDPGLSLRSLLPLLNPGSHIYMKHETGPAGLSFLPIGLQCPGRYFPSCSLLLLPSTLLCLHLFSFILY